MRYPSYVPLQYEQIILAKQISDAMSPNKMYISRRNVMGALHNTNGVTLAYQESRMEYEPGLQKISQMNETSRNTFHVRVRSGQVFLAF